MVSESDISVQGHGVHTAYIETLRALEARSDVTVIPGQYGVAVDCDIIHLHTVGFRALRKLLQSGPKKVVSAHVVPDSFIGSLALAKYWRPLAVWYLRYFYNRADLVVAVSAEAKRDLERMGVHRPIALLYNFIDTARYKKGTASSPHDVRAQLAIAAEAFVVIGAGQVQPRKRLDWFIDAATALPDIHFVWIGGMPFGKVAADSAAMNKMMDTPPPNLHFTGTIPLDDMAAYYHAADLFCLPSEQETFGLVVVEAAAAGLPVMLRDIEDYGDTFADSALLCDDDTFVRSIRQLQRSPEKLAALAARSQTIAARFDSKAAAAKLMNLYRELVE